MEFIELGKTGLKVSVAGLGCGGFSRLGMFTKGLENAAGIVRQACESGVTFFDTAVAYGTHPAVARGLTGVKRDSYVLSSKFPPLMDDGELRPAVDLETLLDKSLQELETDYLDIWHLHGVGSATYEDVRDRFYPELLRMKEKGKIRFIGITEVFASDTRHEMFAKAAMDDIWEVLMVGHNLLNPSAAERVLPMAMEKGIGTLCMFAVRNALSNPDKLKEELHKMQKAGQLDKATAGEEGILDFLVEEGHAGTIMEAAYRYCRHTDGMDVVLTGTGSVKHLMDNLNSIQLPPLPVEVLNRLKDLFGHIDCVSGQ